MLLDPHLPAIDEVDGKSLNMPPMPVLESKDTPFQKVAKEEKLLTIPNFPPLLSRRRSTYCNRMQMVRYTGRDKCVIKPQIVPEEISLV